MLIASIGSEKASERASETEIILKNFISITRHLFQILWIGNSKKLWGKQHNIETMSLCTNLVFFRSHLRNDTLLVWIHCSVQQSNVNRDRRSQMLYTMTMHVYYAQKPTIMKVPPAIKHFSLTVQHKRRQPFEPTKSQPFFSVLVKALIAGVP